MAEARQCDRCNEFYSLNDTIDERGEYPITTTYKKPVGSMTLYDNNVNRIMHLDLCPRCSRSLIVWLDMKMDISETEIDHVNCPYRKDVVCAPNKDKNCVICDVYKQIFGEEKIIDPPFIACPYLKNETKGLACAHTKTCKGPCELVNKMNMEEDKECSKEENMSST